MLVHNVYYNKNSIILQRYSDTIIIKLGILILHVWARGAEPNTI